MAANRGEWAELYVLLKLLGEGKLYAADENLERNPNSYLKIIQVIREETKNKLKKYNNNPQNLNPAVIEIDIEGKNSFSIPAQEFIENADILFMKITTATGPSFDVDPETIDFKNRIGVDKFKAPSNGYYSSFGGKNDIIIKVYDHQTSLTTIAGFSIKSKYKNPATLFNAANASSFVYKLSNMNDNKMDDVNNIFTSNGGIDKAKRLKYFEDNNVQLSFSSIKKSRGKDYSVFKENLEMVRGDMPEIINAMLISNYFYKGRHNNLTDINNILIEQNPLNKRHPETFYKKAIKDFLYASFAGMTASELWDGNCVVNGGYIVAKDNGEVLVYHTRDGESFRSFLFNNTKIDRPAAQNHNTDYFFIYKENGEYYFDLNFQIRFK